LFVDVTNAFGSKQSDNGFEHRNGLAAGFSGQLSTLGNSSHTEMYSSKRSHGGRKENLDLPAKWR